VEIQGAVGQALKGFAMKDCDEIYGDYLDKTATWKGSGDVSALQGQAVRLRFSLSDADLYSLCFVAG